MPLAAVCACVHACVTHVRTCPCFHPFFRCTRYLLSAHYVPGTGAEFLWVSLHAILASPGGSFSASLSPNCYLFVSLGVSGCVCPWCISLCPCFSAGPFCVSPFLGVCPCPFDAHRISEGPWSALGPLAVLTSPAAPSLPPRLSLSVPREPFLAPSSLGMSSASKGLCPGALAPGPNLSARNGVGGAGGRMVPPSCQ